MLVNIGADSNPARVIARGVCHDWEIFISFIQEISISVECRNTHMYQYKLIQLELRGSRTTVRPVLPIQSNHCSLRTALHHFLRDDPFFKYLTRAFC
jgi:hypothetical protein